MWSLGIANACEISIPSLGLDDKHCAAAAAAAEAADAKGLSFKRLDKGGVKGQFKAIERGGRGLGKPFSMVQLKEMGASLAKNCGRWHCVGWHVTLDA